MGKLFEVVCDLNKRAANKSYALRMEQPQPLPAKAKDCTKLR